jgi:imidazolonepropionase-like amidohydrolase
VRRGAAPPSLKRSLRRWPAEAAEEGGGLSLALAWAHAGRCLITLGGMKPSSALCAFSVAAVCAAVAIGQPSISSSAPLPPPNGPRKSDPAWHALVNATLHTAPGKVLKNATVVIRNGRIVSVGADGEAPTGARVWDCKGLHIYPAFVEPYLEVDAPRPGLDAAGRHWNGAITPERSALDGAGITEAAAKELRDMGFGTAAISPRGGIIRGTSAVVSLAKRDADVSQARPEIYASDVYMTCSLEDGSGESLAWASYPGSQMGAIALLRQTFIDADWQSASRAGSAFVWPAGSMDALWRGRGVGVSARNVAGGPGVEEEKALPLVFDCADELEVLRAAKIASEFDRKAVILGSGLEFRRLAAVSGLEDVSFILPMSFPDAPKMASIAEAESIELREMMTWEQAPTNLRRMIDAGETVALTSSKLRGRGKFWENVRTAIRHGVTPDDVMAMVTVNAANAAGVADQVGTIEVGKRANLTITDGDWFDLSRNEKSAKPKIREVWVDGERHEVTAAPGLELEGTWEMTLDPMPPAMTEGKMRLTLGFDGENKLTLSKYSLGEDGKAKVETIKPKEFKLEKNRLSFTFEHQPFGEPGVFISQGVVEGEVIHGEVVRSSGVRGKFVATKSEKPTAIGEWRVSSFEGKEKDPSARDQMYVSITSGSVTLNFIDEKGKRTVIKCDDVKIGPDEKELFELRANQKDEAEVAGRAVTFTHGLEKLGGKGKSTDTVKIDPANPDLLVGEGVMPKEEGQAEAAKHAYTLVRLTDQEIDALRASRRPVGMQGTWQVTLLDDDASHFTGDTKTLVTVDDAGEVTFTGPGVDGKEMTLEATEEKVGDREMSYTLTFPAAGEGEAANTMQVEARRTNDLLWGTLKSEHGTHTWKAARVAVWGDEPGEDDAEILEIATVPERLGNPFGPYTVMEVPAVQNVVVQNATIWTSGPGGNIENGKLVVINGKVEAIAGPDVMYKLPPDTLVIDAKGKHVTPGLIDCHSHTGISGGVNEGGQAVTSEVRIGDVTNPDAISWYRQLAGGITTVNNLHGSANPIGGQNQVNKNRWGSVHPDDLHFEGAIAGIKFALGENVKQGNSPRATTRYPRSRMGVETVIRDRFTAAKEYIARRDAAKEAGIFPVEMKGPVEESYARLQQELAEVDQQREAVTKKIVKDTAAGSGNTRDQVELSALNSKRVDLALDMEAFGTRIDKWNAASSFHRDLELEALAEILEGKRLIHCHSYRQDEILMLCRVAEDFGFKVGTFQHILEGYKVADELAKHSGGASAFSDWWAYKVEVQDAIPQGGPIMHEQGVTVSFNSDSDEMARRMNVEAAKAVKYSVDATGKPTISPEEALKFVTLNPAKQLRIDGQVGSLEKGKDGDFVIWSGNPLSTFSRAEQTWIDGRCFFSLEKDKAGRERITKERARLTQRILGGKKDAKDAGAGGGKPEGDAPEAGRRRRGPRDGAESMMDAAEVMSEATSGARAGPPIDWYLRKHYMELYMRGLPIDSARPGECGCFEQ